MNEIYDSLLEAMSDAVSWIVGDAGSLRLKHPVKDYIHGCLQRMLNDVLPLGSIHEDVALEPVFDSGWQVSSRPGAPTEESEKPTTKSNKSTKRKAPHDQPDLRQNPGRGSNDPTGREKHAAQTKIGKRPRISPAGTFYCCPFRKRNPQRFNIRDWLCCATQPYLDLPLLKYGILLIC